MFEIFRAISVSRRLDDRVRKPLTRKDRVAYTQESVDAALSDTHNQPWAPSPSDLRQRVLERIELDRSMSMHRTQSRWMIPGLEGLPAVLRPVWAVRAGGLIAICAAVSFLVPSIREAALNRSQANAVALASETGQSAFDDQSFAMATSPDVYEMDQVVTVNNAATASEGSVIALRSVSGAQGLPGINGSQQSPLIPGVAVFGMNDWLQFMKPKSTQTTSVMSPTRLPVTSAKPVTASRPAMHDPLLREAAALRADTSRFTKMILGPLAIPESMDGAFE